MIFTPLPIAGTFAVDLEPRHDERGFFARTWCRREFEAQGLDATVAQESISFNAREGTLRGIHVLRAPHAETKLVRCLRGALFDVLVDLRPGSATHRAWHGLELSADNRRSVYIPPGVAHGFLTLADDTEVAYRISDFHRPDAEAGIRWDDPAFGIVWPAPVRVIAARDAAWPDFVP
jgi:dTDP-4-dehydrorhamnose 3,5-epimerase